MASRRKQRFDTLARRTLEPRITNWEISTDQVVECKTAKLCWLNSKIPEGLGSRIDLLVNKFALNFIGGQNRPPESLVQETGSGLEDPLGKVDVSAVLDDFLIY